MAGFMKVLKAILALIIGAGLAIFWSTLRNDPQEIVWGVGLITALAAFICFYFMGKGGGG